jgi:hypothetical protein
LVLQFALLEFLRVKFLTQPAKATRETKETKETKGETASRLSSPHIFTRKERRHIIDLSRSFLFSFPLLPSDNHLTTFHFHFHFHLPSSVFHLFIFTFILPHNSIFLSFFVSSSSPPALGYCLPFTVGIGLVVI